MADLQRKTANLFDKNDVEKYPNTTLSGSSYWQYGDYTGYVVRIACLPNTTYTLKYFGTESLTIWRVKEIATDDVPNALTPNIPYSASYASTVPANYTTTFTTTNSAKYIVFQTNSSLYDAVFEDLMFSEGQPIDYEPYWKHSLRKLTTATEAVENPLYADGTAITSYTIKGNTTQSGTPTPSNPVAVNGVGENTINMCNVSYDTVYNQGTSSAYQYTINSDKTITIPEGKAMYSGFKIKVSPSTTYTIHCAASSNGQMRLREYSAPITDWTTNYIKQTVNVTIKQSGEGYGTVSFTTTAETEWVIFHWYIDPSYSPCTLSEIMMVQGNYDRYTLPAYEPYGYKIPITSGSTTTNIYLGSTSSTRATTKIVITGAELGWNKRTSPDNSYSINYGNYGYSSNSIVPFIGKCTHAENIGDTVANMLDGNFYVGISAFSIRIDNCTTKEDFLTFAAQQYSNGTPITLYLALNNPTTGTVNEPLMKIGDYADTLSNATAIPTIEGANSITVDTTVQPSEFTATWTGWHDANVKEWDSSDWQ